MEKSLVARLSSALLERFSNVPGLAVTEKDGRFFVDAEGAPEILMVWLYRGQWTVEAPDGHAHLDDFEEAVALILKLLGGEARFANEYRGDGAHASAWIEVWDGEAYEARHRAFMLTPFDRDEWIVWPGEAWRVERKALSLGPQGLTVEAFERKSEVASMDGSSMYEAITGALGPPVEGMRWTVAGNARFVFQAPSGWRRRERGLEGPPNIADFAGKEAGIVFRARTYFRDAEAPHALIEKATGPLSIETRVEDPSATDPAWSTHVWELVFSDGETDMMAIIELFLQKVQPARDLLRLIEASVNAARLVPHQWSMGA